MYYCYVLLLLLNIRITISGVPPLAGIRGLMLGQANIHAEEMSLRALWYVEDRGFLYHLPSSWLADIIWVGFLCLLNVFC